MQWAPQTGDTQVITIEKPGGFIDWCISVAKTAVEKRFMEQDAANRLSALDSPRKRNLA